MTESKFTPGPWRVEKSIHFQNTYRVWAGDVFLCAAVGRQEPGISNGTAPEETKANAELMADAPRMVEVLRKVLTYSEPLLGWQHIEEAEQAFGDANDLLEKHGG
jgi:hypothetical protein